MQIPVVFRYPNSKPLFVPTPEWKPGGAPIQMYTLATELAKDSDFKVYFWFDDEVPSIPVEGVHLIAPRPPLRVRIPLLSRAVDLYSSEFVSRIARSGVVIFSVWSNPTFIEHQRRIQAEGGKTIYRIASEVDVDEARRPQGELSRAFTQALIQTDGVIAQTQFQADELHRLLDKESVVIPSTFRALDSAAGEKDIILWVGQAWSGKRPHIVIDIARAIPDQKFVMIMPNSEPACSNDVIKCAEEISNVEIIEYVPLDEIQQYYNRAKIVINTSEYEGFPNTLHQACIGRAPYVSLAWNPDGFFESTGIGMCAENDVSKMVMHIQQLLDNPSAAALIGEKAREYFDANHRVEVVIEKYKDYIRQLVAR